MSGSLAGKLCLWSLTVLLWLGFPVWILLMILIQSFFPSVYHCLLARFQHIIPDSWPEFPKGVNHGRSGPPGSWHNRFSLECCPQLFGLNTEQSVSLQLSSPSCSIQLCCKHFLTVQRQFSEDVCLTLGFSQYSALVEKRRLWNSLG